MHLHVIVCLLGVGLVSGCRPHRADGKDELIQAGGVQSLESALIQEWIQDRMAEIQSK